MNRLAIPLVLFIGGLMLGLLSGANASDAHTQVQAQASSSDWLGKTVTMLTAAGMVSGAFLFMARRIWLVASQWQDMTARVDASSKGIGEVKTIIGQVQTSVDEQGETMNELHRRVSVIESNCVRHRG